MNFEDAFNNKEMSKMWDEYKNILKDTLTHTCKELGVDLKQPKLSISDVKFEGMKTSCKINGKEYYRLCHPEDAFDKEKGILLCIAKAVGINYRDIEKLRDKSKVKHIKKEGHLCRLKHFYTKYFTNQLELVVDKVPDVAFNYLHTIKDPDSANTYKVLGTGFTKDKQKPLLIIRAVRETFDNWYNLDTNIYVVYEDDVEWL